MSNFSGCDGSAKLTRALENTYCKGLNNRGGQKGGYTGYYGYAWAAAPLVVYEIGMFSLGFPEVLPPTIIMTLHIRSIPYIHPFAPHDYSVPYSMSSFALT